MIYGMLNSQAVPGIWNYLLWTPGVAAGPGRVRLGTYAWGVFLAGVTQAMMKGKSDSFPRSLPTSALSLVTEHTPGMEWSGRWPGILRDFPM